jgi:hypothetical protein
MVADDLTFEVKGPDADNFVWLHYDGDMWTGVVNLGHPDEPLARKAVSLKEAGSAALAKAFGHLVIPDDPHAERIFSGERALLVWRERRRLSIDEVATRAGLSADYLAKCEAGTRHLSEANARAVASVLGVDPCELQPFPSAFGHCGFMLGANSSQEEDKLIRSIEMG